MKINKKVHSKEFRNKIASNARTVNKNKKPDGFIYVLQFGNKNIFKFGTSANQDRRIKIHVRKWILFTKDLISN